MANWKEKPFGELVQFPPKISLKKKDSYPFIAMEDIQTDTRYISSNNLKTYTGGGARFENNDILFARITPSLDNKKIAQVKGVDKGFGSTEFFVFRPKEKEIEGNFLYYLSISDLLVKSGINSYVGASGRQRADEKFLKKVILNIPDIPTQKKIAAVLTAYDDLIEINNQRIQILEKMVEQIYREWFVRKRFADKTNVKYDMQPLRNFVENYIGGGWGSETLGSKENKMVYVIRGADFDDVQYGKIDNIPIRYITDSSLESRRLKIGDIVMENSVNHQSRTTGKSILITENLLKLFEGDVICASFCKLIRPKDTYYSKLLSLNFKVLFDLGLMDYFQNIATNGIANLQIERFLDRNPVLVSDDINLELLNKIDSSKYALMIQKLQRTKNLLLPRLLSDKLSVENLNIKFPPSMEEVDA